MPLPIISGNPGPQPASQVYLYDLDSGIHRSLLASDFESTKINLPNGQEPSFSDPINVQLGGMSVGAFGDISTTELNPQIQVYLNRINDKRVWEKDSGSLNSVFSQGSGLGLLSIGSTNFEHSQARTRQKIPYDPGEGVVIRFTSLFNSGVANSKQEVGCFHEDGGFGVGYSGERFGIFHKYNALTHTIKLNITGAASTPGNTTLTLNGTPNIVRLDAAGNIWGDARNITTGASFVENSTIQYNYYTQQVSGEVYFQREISGPITGEFSFDPGSTNAQAELTHFISGKEGVDNWVFQPDFSYDTLSGYGPSQMVLNPQKLNLFEIKYGWLGSAPISFWVGNDSEQKLTPFHTIPWTNNNEIPSIEDPRFPITYRVESAGSTTPMTLKGASAFAGINGIRSEPEKRFTFTVDKTATTTEIPAMTIKNMLVDVNFAATNRRRIYCKLLTAGNESSNKLAKIRVYKALTNNLNTFNFYRNPYDEDSIVLFDKTATAINLGGDEFLVGGKEVAPLGATEFDVDLYLNAGELLIVTTQTLSTTADLSLTLVGYEEH